MLKNNINLSYYIFEKANITNFNYIANGHIWFYYMAKLNRIFLIIILNIGWYKSFFYSKIKLFDGSINSK